MTHLKYVFDELGFYRENVLRDIESLEIDEEFRLLNFLERDYVDSRGKTQPLYNITRDGFSFLVMGYTGKNGSKG